MLSRDIGKHIRESRLKRGLSQSELARSAGVSRTALSRLESQQGYPVQTDVVDRLAARLGESLHVALGNSAGKSRAEERLRLGLQQEERRTRHLRIAVDLCSRPEASLAAIERARRQVALWQEKKSCSPDYIERWSAALAGEPRAVALAMASFGDWENAMFQNTPWSFAWT